MLNKYTNLVTGVLHCFESFMVFFLNFFWCVFNLNSEVKQSSLYLLIILLKHLLEINKIANLLTD